MHPRYAEMLPFATSADEIIAGFRDYTPPARKWVQQPARYLKHLIPSQPL
ncbi:hypothetical protein PT211_18845, partial [Klebsiella pneumoniae]|nr:hypothetical protein [Klebsiella pneumoniae]